MKKKLPLGIFDSGFGGLSVVKSIHKLLPQEDLNIHCRFCFYSLWRHEGIRHNKKSSLNNRFSC